MAQSKSNTHSPKKLDPRAEEALRTNAALKYAFAGAETERPEKINHNKGKVKVKDQYGTVDTKPCKGTCNDCKMRFKCFTERGAVLTEEEWREADVTKGTGKILSEWKESILREMPFVDVKQYSHNMISLALGAIARGWGYNTANKVIDDYGLVALGWHKEKKEKVVAK